MKCIRTLDASHNIQMNWPQQMPSQLSLLVTVALQINIPLLVTMSRKIENCWLN